jgi:hypothetical protein
MALYLCRGKVLPKIFGISADSEILLGKCLAISLENQPAYPPPSAAELAFISG